MVPDGHLDPLFAATVEATEEAVLNALWAAVDTTGRDGRLVRALPHEPVLALLRAARAAVTGGDRLQPVSRVTASRTARSPRRARRRRCPRA